jgi:hypothetical protein
LGKIKSRRDAGAPADRLRIADATVAYGLGGAAAR